MSFFKVWLCVIAFFALSVPVLFGFVWLLEHAEWIMIPLLMLLLTLAFAGAFYGLLHPPDRGESCPQCDGLGYIRKKPDDQG